MPALALTGKGLSSAARLGEGVQSPHGNQRGIFMMYNFYIGVIEFINQHAVEILWILIAASLWPVIEYSTFKLPATHLALESSINDKLPKVIISSIPSSFILGMLVIPSTENPLGLFSPLLSVGVMSLLHAIIFPLSVYRASRVKYNNHDSNQPPG